MKKINSKILQITVALFMMLTFSFCTKHDFLDDLNITGEVGPQAYWEVESSAVGAGKDLGFNLQYYSTVDEIDYSEVWYSVDETVYKSVACPWVSTFTYIISSTNSSPKRISQFIKKYPHSMAQYSDLLRAYVLESDFPVSGTLSPVNWMKPETYDEQKMLDYFGNDFIVNFKDSLYTMMKHADFQKMYLGMGLLEDFKNFTDSTFDDNSNSYVYHFPKDGAGETPIPAEITELYKEIPFDRLVENTSSNDYSIEYKRSYAIKANMRVYDKRGVYGTTQLKEININ